MQKRTSKATPLSILLNLILIINALVVLYPVLFTISSSLTESSSLAATSVIPFTSQVDEEEKIPCDLCSKRDVIPENVLATRELQIANNELNSMSQKFNKARSALNSANLNGKKRDIEKAQKVFDEINAEVQAAQAKVDALQAIADEKAKSTKLVELPSHIKSGVVTQDEAAVYIVDAKEKVLRAAQDAKIYAAGQWIEATKERKQAVFNKKAADKKVTSNRLANEAAENAVNKAEEELAEAKKYMAESNGKENFVECPKCNGFGVVGTGNLTHKFSVKKPSFYQFRRLLTDSDKVVKGGEENNVHGTNYKKWYRNTLLVAIINTIVTVLVCTTSGYIFSRFSFAGRKQIMAGMIVLQMFPSFIGMVATYAILWKLNLLDNLMGLVLVYAAGSIPFNSQLMKGYFDTMPKDIAEAAYIDGASPLGAYIRVILPAAKPQLVFLTLTSFTGPWMDYIFPRMVLRSDENKTLAVGLYEMISGRANDNFTLFAAGAILVAVPFALIFMAGQKSLLQSLAGTSGKE